MGSKADQYEREAKEADEKADTAHDTEVKQMWRGVAAHWRAAATEARRNGW